MKEATRRCAAMTAFMLAGAFASAAMAEPAHNCDELARRHAAFFPGFPDLERDTVEQLSSWRASCATEPPGGLGDVFRLCHAGLPGGGHVFYWWKTAVHAETAGYEICDP